MREILFLIIGMMLGGTFGTLMLLLVQASGEYGELGAKDTNDKTR